MIKIFIAVCLALIISITEYVSKRLDLKNKPYYMKILSFSAGFSITYLLLELLPLFAEAAFSISKFLFLALLLGFISHHVVEKEIYKHNKRHELVKMLNLEENIFYYAYHLILGLVLFLFINSNMVEGIFFALSIFAFTIVSNLPSAPHRSKERMMILSSSTFVGALLGILLTNIIPIWLEFALIGIVAGVLMFTVTRHHIPYRRKGNIQYFILGFLIYAIIIISKWYL